MTDTAASYLLDLGLDVAELERQHGGRALDMHEFLDLCRSIGAMARGHQWWGGDGLVYGEEHYGEEWSQAEAELGVPPQTAANWRYVAKNVERSRRRDELTWSHHAEVARLDPKGQTRMLKWAVDNAATVRQLRDMVAIEFPQAEQLELGGSGLGEAENEDAQRRLERIELTLEAGDDVARGDVVWLVSMVKRLTRGTATTPPAATGRHLQSVT